MIIHIEQFIVMRALGICPNKKRKTDYSAHPTQSQRCYRISFRFSARWVLLFLGTYNQVNVGRMEKGILFLALHGRNSKQYLGSPVLHQMQKNIQEIWCGIYPQWAIAVSFSYSPESCKVLPPTVLGVCVYKISPVPGISLEMWLSLCLRYRLLNFSCTENFRLFMNFPVFCSVLIFSCTGNFHLNDTFPLSPLQGLKFLLYWEFPSKGEFTCLLWRDLK